MGAPGLVARGRVVDQGPASDAGTPFTVRERLRPVGGIQRLEHSFRGGKPHLGRDAGQLHWFDAEAPQALKEKLATCQVHAVEICEAEQVKGGRRRLLLCVI